MVYVTIDKILSFEPYEEYNLERIEELFDGKTVLTPVEISELDISLNDKLWVLSKILWNHSPNRANKLSRRIALDVVHLWDCPDTVWWYLMTGDAAARDAARDAARNAAWAATWDATLEKYLGWFLEVM